MSKERKIPAGRGYHHGNLRQALLDAALALIEAGEEQDVSLRTVAARAGVSNAAPYRHFKDREALMAAVAAIGFDRLLESVRRARESASEGEELLANATAYLAFASKNIGLYRLMFDESHLAIRFDEGLARSGAAAFDELEDLVGTRLPWISGEGEAKRVATAIWAGLHGAALLASGRFIPVNVPPDQERAEAEAMAIARLLIERFSEPKRPSRRRGSARS
jgi:AcrR family transcriptional regulator